MRVRMCVGEWKAPVSAAPYLRGRSIWTPRAWTACGVLVRPTAHRHSCCCLPRWQASRRLQPVRILSYQPALSQLVNMFCKGSSRRKQSCKSQRIFFLFFFRFQSDIVCNAVGTTKNLGEGNNISAESRENIFLISLLF